jgi:outer membrane lipoprotein-sorting protein
MSLEKGKTMNKQKNFCTVLFISLFVTLVSSPLFALDTGDEVLAILKKVDANQSYKTIRYEGKMEIYSGSRVKTKTMVAESSGTQKSFIEFTNPEDRGVRMLKLDKNIWMYFPSERDTVKISGALLRQGLMGSDFSYEDAMESDELLTRYSASILGQELVDGHACHVLELLASAKDVAYSKRKIWIDSELFIVRKSEMYARSGLLLKTSRTLGITSQGGRHFPSVVELSDALKKNSKTVMTMTSLSIDITLDESKFSLQALTR